MKRLTVMTNLCLTNDGNVHIVPYIARLVKVLEPGTHAAAHSSYEPEDPGRPGKRPGDS